MQRIDLHQHVSRQKLNAIRKICYPLFQSSPVEKFWFARRYTSGGVTFLVSHNDWTSYYFEDGAYPDSWFMGLPYHQFHTGFNLWSLAEKFNTQKMDVISENLSLMQYHHGLDVIHKSNQYCDFFGFASRNLDIYRCDLNYLNHFILYFKQHAAALIQGASTDVFSPTFFEPCTDTLPIFSFHSLDKERNESFKINRYYLSGQYDHIYFTAREMDSLHLLNQGHSSKVVAKILGLSVRTVERHVDNMKNKVSVSGLVELLQVAANHHLFKC